MRTRDLSRISPPDFLRALRKASGIAIPPTDRVVTAVEVMSHHPAMQAERREGGGQPVITRLHGEQRASHRIPNPALQHPLERKKPVLAQMPGPVRHGQKILERLDLRHQRDLVVGLLHEREIIRQPPGVRGEAPRHEALAQAARVAAVIKAFAGDQAMLKTIRIELKKLQIIRDPQALVDRRRAGARLKLADVVDAREKW